MKSIFRYSFLFLIVIGLFSCNSKQEYRFDTEEKEILIDLDQPITFDASQFFDTCFIVPLDDRELIGEVSEVYFDQEKIIITDRKITQRIFQFDWKGNLLRLIGTEGEGPGEYKFQRDVQLLSDDEIIIYSNATNKLVFQNIFEKKGRDLKLDTLGPLTDFKWFNSKYHLTRENSSYQSNQIIILDSSFKVLKQIDLNEKFLSQDQSKYGMGKDHLIFPKWKKEGFYFSDTENPYFLDFDNDQLKDIYRVRFSEREVDYSRISTGSELGKLNMAKEFNLVYFSNNLQVHSDFMFLGFGEGIYSKMAIWDKKSKIAYPIKNIENDLTIIPGINSIGISVELSSQLGYHLFMIDAPTLLDMLEEVETKDNFYLERLRALNIQSDDNPVLLFFRFKERVELDFP
jgi:hypothetical protein